MPKKAVTKTELVKIQPIKVSVSRSNNIEIKLPAAIMKAIRCVDNTVHFAVVNNVLQISGPEPALFIPVTSLVREDFKPAND